FLGTGAAGRLQVEVDAVLDRLALLDPDEQQAGSAGGVLDQRLRVTGLVVVGHRLTQQGTPELGEVVGVTRAVEGDVADGGVQRSSGGRTARSGLRVRSRSEEHTS